MFRVQLIYTQNIGTDTVNGKKSKSKSQYSTPIVGRPDIRSSVPVRGRAMDGIVSMS